MSQMPIVKVTLSKYLRNDVCADIHKKISNMKGVLSADFNAKAKEIKVTYAGKNVKNKILRIKGVIGLHDFL